MIVSPLECHIYDPYDFFPILSDLNTILLFAKYHICDEEISLSTFLKINFVSMLLKEYTVHVALCSILCTCIMLVYFVLHVTSK